MSSLICSSCKSTIENENISICENCGAILCENCANKNFNMCKECYNTLEYLN